MKSFNASVIRSFLLARQVNHFYWLHTEGDLPGGKVSIENIELIIERMIRLPINKILVPDGEYKSIRGSFERYANRIDIYIRDGQAEAWQKFTAVKEYCHALIDESDDYSVDVSETINELKQFTGFGESPDTLPSALSSEKLAEIVALELIYPLEFRRDDLVSREKGEEVSAIADRRCVPTLWVEHALGDYHEACLAIWSVLPNHPIDHELNPL